MLTTDEPDSPPPGSLENTKNLHYGAPALRVQVAAVEPQLIECTRRAVRDGYRGSGTAFLTFIIAQQGAKVVVEDTGVDPDQTTIDHEPLLACLRETAHAMTFEGLPREAAALVVRRSVEIAEGQLTANKYVNFSYIR
jgi:hypothetical protein